MRRTQRKDTNTRHLYNLTARATLRHRTGCKGRDDIWIAAVWLGRSAERLTS